jgi:hypothetical protein
MSGPDRSSLIGAPGHRVFNHMVDNEVTAA